MEPNGISYSVPVSSGQLFFIYMLLYHKRETEKQITFELIQSSCWSIVSRVSIRDLIWHIFWNEKMVLKIVKDFQGDKELVSQVLVKFLSFCKCFLIFLSPNHRPTQISKIR